jgi:hypothetical protein
MVKKSTTALNFTTRKAIKAKAVQLKQAGYKDWNQRTRVWAKETYAGVSVGEQTVRDYLRVDFDAIIVSDDAKSTKPPTYPTGRERVGKQGPDVSDWTRAREISRRRRAREISR